MIEILVPVAEGLKVVQLTDTAVAALKESVTAEDLCEAKYSESKGYPWRIVDDESKERILKETAAELQTFNKVLDLIQEVQHVNS